MFVFSMKTTRPRLAAFGVVFGLLAAVTFGLAGRQQQIGVQAGAEVTADGVTYLQELGYEVDPQWVSVREVILPADPDDTLTAYNALQKEAGFDLMPYCGERVKCWTYTVLNYPGTEGVQAHIYEHKGRVIAGDISSTAAEGFSHGLRPLLPTAEKQGETNGKTG